MGIIMNPLVRMYIKMVKLHHPHIHYFSMNFSVFALIYYFLILFIYSVFYSDVPRQSPTGGVAGFFHGVVAPKPLISALNALKVRERLVCSFALIPQSLFSVWFWMCCALTRHFRWV